MSRKLRFRILYALLALTILVSGLIAATPYLINMQVVKNQISRQISDWMGLPVHVRGEPVVTVFPYITFKLKNVQVSSKLGVDEPDLVSMSVLRAEMYWLPLLLGKFEVRRFHLDNPKFEFVRDAAGNTSWDMTGGSLVSTDPDDGRLKLSDISLGTIRITNGSARMRDAQTGWDERLSNINLGFDWPNTGEAASLTGSVVWRDQSVDYTLRSGNPKDLFGGGLSPIWLDVKSPMFAASLDGSAATMAQLQLEGDFAFETPSVRLLLDWLGLPMPLGDGFGPAQLKARSNLVGASVSFSDMEMRLDEHRADGVLQLDFRRERPLIQGTLASDQLDLGLYLRSFEQSIGQQGSLLDYSVSAEDLLRADLDIRLSTDQLIVSPIQLGRTAASLVTRNSQLSFSIGETYAYGGRLEASLDMHPSKKSNDKMRGYLRAKANGLLAGTIARELTQTQFLTGTTLAELDVEGEGMTLREMLKGATGDLSLVITEGAFERFNLDILQQALLDDATEASQPTPDGLYQGGTAFDVLSMKAGLANDALTIDEFRLTSGKRALRGNVEVKLTDMTLDFPASLLLFSNEDPASHATDEDAKQYPFHLTGSVFQPVLTRKSLDQQPSRQTDASDLVDQTKPKDGSDKAASVPEAEVKEQDQEPEKTKNIEKSSANSEPDKTTTNQTESVAGEQTPDVPSTTEKLKEAISEAVNDLFQLEPGSEDKALQPANNF